MTKSNKILCIVGAILIAFVGLFGIVFATQEDRVVKADYVESTYYSNYYYTPISFVTSSHGTTFTQFAWQDICTMYARFIISSTSVKFNGCLFGNLTSSNTIISSTDFVNINFNTVDTWIESYWYANTNAYIRYSYYIYSGFDASSLSYILLSSLPRNTFNNQPHRAQNEFTLVDSNDKRIMINFSLYMTSSNDNLVSYSGNGILFATNQYFLSNTGSISDNQYYQSGYNNGYDVGNSAGYDTGYSAGYDVGNNAGYDTGYSAGVQDANDYTFLGLIGATIDAPISAFTSFFDFELLGVNLKDFFFAILTFALVIVIIRFALAR